MNQDVKNVELVGLSSIPYNMNRGEYYLIDAENQDMNDLYYVTPSSVKHKMCRGCILIKIIKKQGQKS